MEEIKKKEIKDLVERIGRLEKEAALYYGEAREPIEYNIERLTDQLEEILKPCRNDLEELEKQSNEQIEKLEEEANKRIERLEQEAALYYGEAREPMEHNIERIKDQLEADKEAILSNLEEEKQKRFKELEDLGLELKKYGFIKEEEPKVEPKEEPKVEPKEEPKVEPKAEPKVEPKEEPKVEPKAEPKAEPKVEPKVEPKAIISKNIRVFYSAKRDAYVLTDKNSKIETVVRKRSAFKKLNKAEIEEENGIDLTNVDMYVLQVIYEYDKELAKQYYMNLSGIGKNKEQRINEMKEMGIELEYDLKGLYSQKDKLDEYELSKEERKEILDTANNAKKKGLATVKKGFVTAIREKIELVTDKLNPKKLLGNGRKTRLLPTSKKEQQRQEQKQEEYDKLVNKDYMESLDGEFDKALKQTKREAPFKNIKAKVDERKAMKDAGKKSQGKTEKPKEL